jgi:hypothetical protein
MVSPSVLSHHQSDDREDELGRPLNRKIARLGAAENLINIVGGAMRLPFLAQSPSELRLSHPGRG